MVAPSRHAPSFERLVNYIERNIKLELGADELAQYAGLSLRSLYLLFEKNVKTTPKNFVRQKKLEKVHSILNDPAQACPNVTAVALEYGFSHLGRFSELYKSTYGVLPSQSFRCRQPHARRGAPRGAHRRPAHAPPPAPRLPSCGQARSRPHQEKSAMERTAINPPELFSGKAFSQTFSISTPQRLIF